MLIKTNTEKDSRLYLGSFFVLVNEINVNKWYNKLIKKISDEEGDIMIDIVERNEVVQFKNGDFVLDVTIDSNKETVWLNREQLSQLFDRDIKTIGRHINNALKEELDNSTVAKFATVQKEGTRQVTRQIEYYNLDNKYWI